MKSVLLSCIIALMAMASTFAQVSITSPNQSVVIDFDATLAGINNGTFDGTGLSPMPAAGQLDADGIRVRGLSDNSDFDFGETGTSGDFSRGVSTGGETSGGLYAFDVGSGDFAVGFQPTSGDWTPGTFEIKVDNKTSTTITELQIAYEVHVLNNADRGQSIVLAYSTDDVTYTTLPGTQFTTPATSDMSSWVQNDFSETITGLSIAPDSSLYLRWTSNDDLGGGSRDEIAFDDISIIVGDAQIPQCNIASVDVTNVSQCFDNFTPDDPTDDYFTADVVIDIDTLLFIPDTVLLYYGDDTIPSQTAPLFGPGSDTTVVILADTFPADGVARDLRLEMFLDGACTFFSSDLIPAVNSCGNSSCPQPGDLIISEFLADPDGGDASRGEYVELYNTTADTISLDGLRLFDDGVDNHIIDDPQLVILPNDYVVLARSTDVPNVDYVYTGFQLSNSADEINLSCSDVGLTEVIVSLDYFDGDQFGDGVAYELDCNTSIDGVMNLDDYQGAPNTFTYVVGGSDFGSPGSAGASGLNVTATTLQFASFPPVIASDGLFEVTVCATDAAGVTPCDYTEFIALSQTEGPAANILNDSVQAVDGCATFVIFAPTSSGCDSLSFAAQSEANLLTDADLSIALRVVAFDGMVTCDSTSAWTVYNLDGAQSWLCRSDLNGYRINTFRDTVDNMDYLVSPTLDLTGLEDVVVSFITQERRSGRVIDFLVSTDFAGDPTVATWTAIPFAFDTTANGGIYGPAISSGLIDVGPYLSSTTTFAFYYETMLPNDPVSDWLVTDFSVSGCPVRCALDDISATNVSACDSATNTFTADVQVWFTDLPSSGSLILSGSATDTIDITGLNVQPGDTVVTLPGITFMADGGLKSLRIQSSGDTACFVDVEDIPGTDVQPCGEGARVYGGLVINEVWNARTGTGAACGSSEAFIELVAVASVDEDTTTQFVNLERWIIDPNNSNDEAGHLRIRSGCYTSVPVGALIVIYNADAYVSIVPDEMDTDGDLVYYIPSNSGCLEYTTDASYPGLTYKPANDGNCSSANQLSSSNSFFTPFVAETRHPHNFIRSYTNVYDALSFDPADGFSPAGAAQFLCGNIHDASAIIQDATPTMGTANDIDNQRLIDQIRSEAGNSLSGSGPRPEAVNYALLLPVGPTPGCDDLIIDCPDTLHLTGPLTVTTDQFAGSYLRVSGDVTVSGSVRFSAPTIEFEPTFEVPLGAEIQTTNTGCSTTSTLPTPRYEGGDRVEDEYEYPALPFFGR